MEAYYAAIKLDNFFVIMQSILSMYRCAVEEVDKLSLFLFTLHTTLARRTILKQLK